MIALGHTGSGVLVGLVGVSALTEIPVPLPLALMIVLLSGIAAHYIGDWLPHGHYRFDPSHPSKTSIMKLGIDLLLPLILVLLLSVSKFGLGWEFGIIVAALAGVHLPDVFENLIDLKLLPNTAAAKEHRRFHYDRLHWHNDRDHSDLPNGARVLSWIDTYQLALLALAIYLLI